MLADGSQIQHFFTARWHHFQQRHLGSYQWLLMLDGDAFALNMSQSLDKFLAAPEDVVLHIRWAEGWMGGTRRHFVSSGLPAVQVCRLV